MAEYVLDEVKRHPWLYLHVQGLDSKQDIQRIRELKNRVYAKSDQIQDKLSISGHINNVAKTVKKYNECEDSTKQFLLNNASINSFDNLFFVYSDLDKLLRQDFSSVLVADKLAISSTKNNHPAYSVVISGTPTDCHLYRELYRSSANVKIDLFGNRLKLEYPTENKIKNKSKRFISSIRRFLKDYNVNGTSILGQLNNIIQGYNVNGSEHFSKKLLELVFKDLTKRTIFLTISDIQPLLKDTLKIPTVYENVPTIIPQSELIVNTRTRHYHRGIQNKISLEPDDIIEEWFFNRERPDNVSEYLIFINSPFYDNCACQNNELVYLSYELDNNELQTYYSRGKCIDCGGMKKSNYTGSGIIHDSIIVPALISYQTNGIRVAQPLNEEVVSAIFYNSLQQNVKNIWELNSGQIKPYIVSGSSKFLGYYKEQKFVNYPTNTALMVLFGKNNMTPLIKTDQNIIVKNQTYSLT